MSAERLGTTDLAAVGRSDCFSTYPSSTWSIPGLLYAAMNPGRPRSHLSCCFWFLCGILSSDSFSTADKFDESELLLKWFRLYLKCNYVNSVKNIILMLGNPEGLITHVTLGFCRPKDIIINLIPALNLVRPSIIQNQVIFIFLYIYPTGAF